MTAPIALFCFRRPDHLRRTLAALATNHGASDHDVVAFADGPRHAADTAGVEAVRRELAEWAGRGVFRSFVIDAADQNRGLRGSIVRGVGRLVAEAGTVIVVEDDIETSAHFIAYCEDGLRTYAEMPEVASVHGYIYPVPETLPETFFLRGADCWGWATWRRAWAGYDDDAAGLHQRLCAAGLERAFDHGGARDLTRMLAAARDGLVDSWAVRWHASAFLAGRHTLYPGRSLVRNIGVDASGTHCGDGAEAQAPLSEAPVRVLPMPIKEDLLAWRAVRDHFRRERSWLRRAARRWKRLLPGGRS